MKSKSIIQDEKRCYLCQTVVGLDRHHCLEGAFKKIAEKLGLWVWLCRRCHKTVQGNEDNMQRLREIAQLKAMKHYKWTATQFKGVVGRNFLEGENYEQKPY